MGIIVRIPEQASQNRSAEDNRGAKKALESNPRSVAQVPQLWRYAMNYFRWIALGGAVLATIFSISWLM